jgi:hypothetical protein
VGDGKKGVDILIANDGASVQLRAERDGELHSGLESIERQRRYGRALGRQRGASAKVRL